MQKFNQSIQIEVSVDSIADNLLANMNPEFKHSQLVVETLIGRMLSQDKSALSYLYNSLNGYTNEIDFQVGDVVCPKDLDVYGYWTPESIEKGNSCYGKITQATVKSINLYADEKLEIEYQFPNKKGETDTNTRWYHHTRCNKIQL